LLDEVASAHELAMGIDGDLARARCRTATILESTTGHAIRVSGELDLASAPYVAARLVEHVRGSGDIVIDAGALSFADVSGCRALVQTALAMSAPRQLVIQGARAQLVRVLELCGWRDVPRLEVRPEGVQSPGIGSCASGATVPGRFPAKMSGPGT
jgi:anti-anti-sigma factor